MRPATRHRLARVALSASGALAGLVVAFVVMLNIHIWVGLEQGYAATPAEVLDASVLLAAVDGALLVALPVAGAVAGRRLARSGGAPPRDGTSPGEPA